MAGGRQRFKQGKGVENKSLYVYYSSPIVKCVYYDSLVCFISENTAIVFSKPKSKCCAFIPKAQSGNVMPIAKPFFRLAVCGCQNSERSRQDE